jgi:hypothetical protein
MPPKLNKYKIILFQILLNNYTLILSIILYNIKKYDIISVEY